MKSFSRRSPNNASTSTPWHASYQTRFLAALAGTLLLIVMLVHLPIRPATPQLGWRVDQPDERIQLQELASEKETPESSARIVNAEVPPTVQSQPAPSEPTREPVAQTLSEPEQTPEPEREESPEIYQLSALGPSADRPRIKGGAGTFFLRINYPEEARRKGIEGRVILDFIVDKDGHTHDIIVRKSLHPLCDSSAVRALRDTRFVPGKRLGKPVNVRMRLPVRFRLIGATDQALATDKREASGGS